MNGSWAWNARRRASLIVLRYIIARLGDIILPRIAFFRRMDSSKKEGGRLSGLHGSLKISPALVFLLIRLDERKRVLIQKDATSFKL